MRSTYAVHRRRETAYMLNGLLVVVVGLEEFIQNGEYLRIQHLEAPNPVNHAFQTLEKQTKHKKIYRWGF